MKTETQTHRSPDPVKIVRHAQVCQKISVSSAKLFDMVARGQFIKPFPLVPGGRAVGWIEADVDRWILARKAANRITEAA
jgi:predicted DNA-binding transcriptional regulator AlpA